MHSQQNKSASPFSTRAKAALEPNQEISQGGLIWRKLADGSDGVWRYDTRVSGHRLKGTLGRERRDRITLSQARGRLEEVRAQAVLASPAAQGRGAGRVAVPAFEEASRGFLEWSKAHHADYQHNLGRMQRRLVPRFGGHRLDQITVGDVEAFRTELLEEGLSKETVRRLTSLLSGVLSTRANMIGGLRIQLGRCDGSGRNLRTLDHSPRTRLTAFGRAAIRLQSGHWSVSDCSRGCGQVNCLDCSGDILISTPRLYTSSRLREKGRCVLLQKAGASAEWYWSINCGICCCNYSMRQVQRTRTPFYFPGEAPIACFISCRNHSSGSRKPVAFRMLPVFMGFGIHLSHVPSIVGYHRTNCKLQYQLGHMDFPPIP